MDNRQNDFGHQRSSSSSQPLAYYIMGLDSSGVCKQQRLRPACASAQTDQHLCYLIFGKCHISTCYKPNFNALAS